LKGSSANRKERSSFESRDNVIFQLRIARGKGFRFLVPVGVDVKKEQVEEKVLVECAKGLRKMCLGTEGQSLFPLGRRRAPTRDVDSLDEKKIERAPGIGAP